MEEQWLSGRGPWTSSSACKLDGHAHSQAPPTPAESETQGLNPHKVCFHSQVQLMCVNIQEPPIQSMDQWEYVKYMHIEENTPKDEVVLSVIGLWMIFAFPYLSFVIFIYAAFF